MKQLAWLSILILTIWGCRNDFEEITVVEETISPPVLRISGNVAGRVLNENNLPVVGAKVELYHQSTITDERGYFVFIDGALDENGTYLRVKKEGYFNGSKRFFPIKGSDNYTIIQLMSNSIVGVFEASDGGSISTEDELSIEFAPNSLEDELGKDYQGEVSVAARWLNPLATTTLDLMPGNLQGQTLNGEEEALITYGMAAIELTGSSGIGLNLKEGHTAIINFPIPNELVSKAPNSIPLWSFDESKGVWVEEGSANKQNGVYRGIVSHFSFWNCDIPFPVVELKGSIKYRDGTIAANTKIKITSDLLGTVIARTDDSGQFRGKVPRGEQLHIKVFGSCDQVLYEGSIGPFSENTTVDFEVAGNELTSVSVTGTLINCEGNGIAGGIIELTTANFSNFILVNEDGSFSTSYKTCPTDFISIRGIDPIGLKWSALITQALNGEPINTGSLLVCEEPLDSYVILVERDSQILFPNAVQDTALENLVHPDKYTGISAQINVGEINIGVGMGIYFDPVEGTFRNEDANFGYSERPTSGGAPFREIGCFFSRGCDESEFMIEITKVEAIGGSIEGSFSGSVPTYIPNEELGQLQTVSGIFKIKRLQ